ncbi:putative membrane protein, putative phage gene [Aliivibrio salmonicida LFI1238]|uniref:Membrane protein, putative phage protein n=2 Tax=Aliivibrio salmonicida TaxID=40269 RepID=B6EME8_ALISL|nr:putative membrane protein, putative phage gene [Aliivibrio salmonicida LFI1238]
MIMNKAMDFLVLQVEYLVHMLTSRAGYITLFKGGLALATLCIISVQQVFTLAIPIESEAYKLKYEVEFSTQKQYESFDSMICNLQDETYAKCKLAIQKESLISSSFDALYSWLELFSVLAALMIFFSILGFLANPHFHKVTRNEPFENQET